jgi:hypothetical protein
MEEIHPAIVRCPVPVGDLPDRSGYLTLVGATRAMHAQALTHLLDPAIGRTPPPAPRRYVALTWGAGDEAELDDGRVSGTAPDWGPFLAFLQGAGWAWIAAHGLDFGSGDGPPARHALVCDRQGGAGWAMPWRWASLLVRTQAPDELRRALAAEAAERAPADPDAGR